MDIVSTLPPQSDGGRREVIDTINRASVPVEAPSPPSGFDALGQGDFLKLLTVQLQQQDPFDPVDNTQMLAQMAQFSALAGTTQTNATLSDIAARIDALAQAQDRLAATLVQTQAENAG